VSKAFAREAAPHNRIQNQCVCGFVFKRLHDCVFCLFPHISVYVLCLGIEIRLCRRPLQGRLPHTIKSRTCVYVCVCLCVWQKPQHLVTMWDAVSTCHLSTPMHMICLYPFWVLSLCVTIHCFCVLLLVKTFSKQSVANKTHLCKLVHMICLYHLYVWSLCVTIRCFCVLLLVKTFSKQSVANKTHFCKLVHMICLYHFYVWSLCVSFRLPLCSLTRKTFSNESVAFPTHFWKLVRCIFLSK
jgi:hypothetical protein